MIKIENLCFTYPGADQPQLNEVDLEIKQGDFVAIVGNNGCGKSTLCKTLNGLIPHYFSGDFSGHVWINEKNTQDYSIGELAQEIGYVYQDFENQIVRPTVLDEASFACLNYAMKDYIDRGREALQLTGLYHKEEAYIWQLSGGQKHLLALAGAIALSPGIVILDEPIAQLDPQHATMIYELLKRLNEEQKMTIIVIEHHTEFIADYCHEVMMMKDGRIAWKLPTKEALNRIEELQGIHVFPPQVTLASKQAHECQKIEVNGLYPIKIEEAAHLFQSKRLQRSSIKKYVRPSDECVIEFSDVRHEYRAVKGDNKVALNQFNLNVYKGDKIALIGNNGAGKSTILKLMTGLMKPKVGSVTVCDHDTRAFSAEQLSSYVSLVYQNPEQMFIKDNIFDDIAFSMKLRAYEDYEQRTQELLKMFRLENLRDRDGRLLSGGQMRRASLAIGVALGPEVILLDEPTANLDIATRQEIMKILNATKDVMQTAIIATHDMQLVAEWADRIIVLNNGYIIADGSRDEIFGNQRICRQAGIRPPDIYSLAKLVDDRMNCYHIEQFVEALEG